MLGTGIGRHSLLWSQNTFTMSFKNISKACDRRLLRFMSDINKHQRTECHSVMWGLELECAGLAYSRRRHPQVICEIQSPHLEEYCSYWDRTRFFQFHGCARSNLRLPHSSAEAATVSLDAGVAEGRFASAKILRLCAGVLSNKLAKGSLGNSDVTGPFILIHVLSGSQAQIPLVLHLGGFHCCCLHTFICPS